MAQEIIVEYSAERDILRIQYLPTRAARMDESQRHFFVRHDWNHPDEIVGFEALDFSLLVPHLFEAGTLPDITTRFDVPNGGPKNITLRQVLEWAYRHFILHKLPLVGMEIEATTPFHPT